MSQENQESQLIHLPRPGESAKRSPVGVRSTGNRQEARRAGSAVTVELMRRTNQSASLLSMKLASWGFLAAFVLGVAAAHLLQAQGPPSSNTAARGESLYQQLSRSVVRLEGPNGVSVGTGFFVVFQRETYLVSARHIAEKSFDLRSRVPSRNRESGATEVVELRVPKEAWVYHPDGAKTIRRGSESYDVAAVDVAAVKIPTMRDLYVVAVGYCPEPCESGEVDQFADSDPEPPQIAIIIGFPRDLGLQLREQRPMVNLGLVALVSEEFLISNRETGQNLDSRVVLVDTDIFPGNSGSPMFVAPGHERKFDLLGLLVGGHGALGYAVAEPVSRIAETLEVAARTETPATPSWYRLDQ